MKRKAQLKVFSQFSGFRKNFTARQVYKSSFTLKLTYLSMSRD